MYDRLVKAIENSGASVVVNGKLVKDAKPEVTQTNTVNTKAEEGKMTANEIIKAAKECAKG